MPRRREVPKREILPDPKFGNVDVAKFMNVLMLSARSPLPSVSSMALSSRSRRRPARIRWKCSWSRSTTSSRWSK